MGCQWPSLAQFQIIIIVDIQLGPHIYFGCIYVAFAFSPSEVETCVGLDLYFQPILKFLVSCP